MLTQSRISDRAAPPASVPARSTAPAAPVVAPPRSIKILGSSVHLVDLEFVMGQMRHWIEAQSSEPRRLVVSGFHGLWLAHKHPDLKRMLRTADLWLPDGIAPVCVARLRGHRQVCRVAGAELMQAFFAMANERGYGSYFFGDTAETLKDLSVRVAAQYPRHKIVGTFSPPFRPVSTAEDERIIEQINRAKPDVLWVGLGLPKQERWIFEHRDRLHVPVVVGVGAAFGFLSGRVRRCPRWLGDSGFEWAYRFLSEPKKLWRRDLLEAPRFLVHLALELSGLRKYD